jgi:hypothetical protein
MLETIHEYAREKLEESGETDALEREHALYYMRLAEEAEPHLTGKVEPVQKADLQEFYSVIDISIRNLEELDLPLAVWQHYTITTGSGYMAQSASPQSINGSN